MNIEERVRHTIGDYVIQILALQAKIEQLEAQLKEKKPIK